MSLTALAWLCCFATFVILAFRRPSWGIALYLLVFYVDPNFWWWGRIIRDTCGYRLSLTAALIFAVAVFTNRPKLRGTERKLLFILLLYAFNATVVHVLFASNLERSADGLDLLWKSIALLFLMLTSIKDRVDWKIFVYSIIVGSLYIGYEMVINDRGNFSASRYERVIASGVSDSNYLAGLLSLAVPLAGALFLIGNKWEKVLALVSLPLICNTIVLCNSRGGFLAILAGGAWLALAARGRLRRYVVAALLLSALAAVVLVRDQDIVDRFASIFVSAEERDRPAQGRLDYWTAAARMLKDRPFGSGAEAAFKSNAGLPYLADIGATDYRAVHNGYLDVACAWGVQGAALYGLAIYLAWRLLRRATRHVKDRRDWPTAFFGLCIQAAFVTQLVSAFFLSSFDGEWFFWMMALAMSFDRLFGPESATVPVASTTQATPLPAYG